MRALHKEMTLIEWISLHDFDILDYKIWAERKFCKPSRGTLEKAQKVLKKLDARWDEMMEFDSEFERNTEFSRIANELKKEGDKL